MLSAKDLEAFLQQRLSPQTEPSRLDAETVLIEALSASILQLTAPTEWCRRPSLCHDGTPAQLSHKLSESRDDAVRLLVEPGNLGMTVAEQISFSLSTLDEILGRLSWRSAVDDVNTITSALLPADAQETRDWWGGMWLGTALSSPAAQLRSPAELRMYINLRFGDAQARWHRVAELFSRLRCHDDYPDWFRNVTPIAIPVGLGVVIADGRVVAIRVYVAAPTEDLAFLSVCAPISAEATDALTRSFTSFVDQLGLPPSKTVTIGFDFLRNGAADFNKRIGRVKVELSCQGVEQPQNILPWVADVLAEWSLDAAPLRGFTDDIAAIWSGCDIQHVSLGFAPRPEHVTVYVKPW